jgi:lysophospholipase L1-like esterase
VTSPTGLPMSVRYGSVTSAGGTTPVQISCTPPNDSTFPIGTTTVTCTATDAKNVTASCSFGVTVIAPAKISLTTFVAFGDSMTAGEITDPNAIGTRFTARIIVPSKSYPADLNQELSARYTSQNIQVTNAGKPGESVQDPATLPRLDSYLSSNAYKVLLLMEGANDINSRDSKSIAPTVAGIDQMVRDAKSRGMRVFLATLPPQNPLGPLGTGAILVQPYNDQLRSLAAAENITLVDVFQAFGGDVTTLIGVDGLHPTTAGYQKIADTFFAAIKQALELPPTGTTTLTIPFVSGAMRR